MGACYSRQGHESSLSQKNKSPHPKYKPHKNGVAVTVEYTQSRPPEDGEKLLDGVDTGNGVVTKTSEDLQRGRKNNKAEDKTALLDNKGVAPSDSGIESLSPSETDQSDGMTNAHHVGQNKSSAKERDVYSHTCSPSKSSSENKDSNRRSCDSTPVSPLTEEPIEHDNAIGLESVHVEVPRSKRSSRDLRHFDSEPSLQLSSLYPSLQDVKTMQMDGREVVVIDVDTYCTIMDEIALLKLKLSQLTDFLQLQDLEQNGSLSSDNPREKLDFSSTSSYNG